jgi:hypothetical protein
MKNAVVQTVVTPIVSDTTTNYWNGIQQNVEGLNIYDLLGKTVTISFIFETNVSGIYSFCLSDSNSSYSYVATFTAVAGVPEQVVIPVGMFPTYLVIPNTSSLGLQLVIGFLNTGTYQTSTLGTWQPGIWRSAAGATNWGMTIGNYIAVTNLQLEAGTVATTFENRPYGSELALCQRYYQILNTGLYETYQLAGNNIACALTFPVPLRTIPTYTLITTGNIGFVTEVTVALAYTTNTVASIIATASTTGNVYFYGYVYGFAAEL